MSERFEDREAYAQYLISLGADPEDVADGLDKFEAEYDGDPYPITVAIEEGEDAA